MEDRKDIFDKENFNHGMGITTDSDLVVYYESSKKDGKACKDGNTKMDYIETDEEKFDIQAMKADLLKKVEALELNDVKNTFSEKDVLKAAFPESLKIEEEKERIKFERKSQLRKYKRTSDLLNEAYSATRRRETLEKQFPVFEAKVSKEREAYEASFQEEKARIQASIDALKQQMVAYGNAHREAAKLGEKDENVTQMVAQMQEYNIEMEALQSKFNHNVAKSLFKLDEFKNHITEAKVEENFHKSVVKAWVKGEQEKKKPIREAVKTGVQQICEYTETQEESKNSQKVTYRQRVVAALRQIYNYLCKKLHGIKREKAIKTGKQAIQKAEEKDYTLNVTVNNQPASPSRMANKTL